MNHQITKYKSHSSILTKWYLLLMFFSFASMIVFDLYRLEIAIMVILIHIPLLPATYLIGTYYYIKDNQIVKETVNPTKPDYYAGIAHAQTITISLIDKIELKHKDKTSHITMWSDNDRIPLGVIRIENGKQFIQEILSIKADIVVISL